jgi:ribosomal protein S18 acetylase RimI-like enzyme
MMLKYKRCTVSGLLRESEEFTMDDARKLRGKTMDGLIEPICLEHSKKERASEVLTNAFLDDPLYATIFPDRAERQQSLRWLWQALINYTLVYGEIYTTPELDGVACWLLPGNTQQTLWRVLRTGMGFVRAVLKFEAGSRSLFLKVMNYVEKEHQRLMQQPHWYLWALGVQPDSQGQGIGGRLIQPVLERSAEEGLPCYLETQKEGNVAFYQKHGFEVLSVGEVLGNGIMVWMMVKKP